MVVVKLVGGLASQLHKYAIIKSICEKNGRKVKVDLSFYTDRMFKFNNIMEYGLPKIGIVPEIASKKDIVKAKGYNFFGKIIFIILTGNFLNRNSKGFFERVNNKLESYSFYRNLVSNSYMVVHVSKSADKSWLHEILNNESCYVFGEFGVGFEDIKNVRAELSAYVLNSKISADAEEYKQLILKEDVSVAVHVRRGDYVNNESVNTFHGVCSIDYYKRSINHLCNHESVRLFLFSDDIEWVKENFSEFIPENSVFISKNQGYEDFVLMASCKYHIIANSGFSSMASWLSMAENKNVYSPVRWFVDEETNRNQMSLLPADWNYF
jgi:hypothetical protein